MGHNAMQQRRKNVGYGVFDLAGVISLAGCLTPSNVDVETENVPSSWVILTLERRLKLVKFAF